MKKTTTIEYVVQIPNDEGTAFISEVAVRIPVEIDEFTGEPLLGEEAQRIIDDTRSRHMGLLMPAELKALREKLNFTQTEMAYCLECGEKSYCRWENGNGRQSRFVNNVLVLLRDGKISLSDLAAKRDRRAAYMRYSQGILSRLSVGPVGQSYTIGGGISFGAVMVVPPDLANSGLVISTFRAPGNWQCSFENPSQKIRKSPEAAEPNEAVAA